MPAPQPSRRPRKLPPNVRTRQFSDGWRYRADVMVDAERLYGSWRRNPDEAAKDAREMRERGNISKGVRMIGLQEGMRIVLEDLDSRGRRDGTKRSYREHFRPLFRFFGDCPLHRIDYDALERYRTQRLKARKVQRGKKIVELPPVSHRTIDKDLTHLGRVFAVALKKRLYVGPNPVRSIEKSGQTAPEAGHFTPDQVAKIIASLNHGGTGRPAKYLSAEAMRDVVGLLFFTGMRLGEFVSLDSSCFDLEEGVLEVVDGKSGPRTLPMSKPMRVLAERWMERVPEGPLVGPGKRQNQEQRLKDAFTRWRKRMPERLASDFHAHTFRHSFQTHALEEDVPVHHVVALMGHSRNSSMTLQYAHATPSKLRKSMAAAFDPIAWVLDGERTA